MKKEQFLELTLPMVEEFRADIKSATRDGIVTACNYMIICAIHEDQSTYDAIADELTEEYGDLIVLATLKTVKKIHDDLQNCQSEEEYENIVLGYHKFKDQIDTLMMTKQEKNKHQETINDVLKDNNILPI